MFSRRIIFGLLITLSFHSRAAEPPLAERLISPVADVRDEAVKEFRGLPASIRERFVPSLMVAMGNENPYIRDQAASLLKELGVDARPQSDTPRVSQPSGEATRARDAERQRSLSDIQKTKSDRYQGMKATLDAEKQTQPDWMAMKSGAGASSDIKELLLAGLGDTDPLIRSRSARRLGMIHPTPTEALPQLEQMLGDKDAECRSAAAIALGSFGPAARGLATQVSVLLHDPDARVRVTAQEALRQIQGQ